MALPVCHYNIKNPQLLNFPFYKKSRETTCEVTRQFYVEALVMSTRFLKDHIEIKWRTDGYYHHRELIYARGTYTQSWSQFSRSLAINLE